jgi:hypothetical protein
VKRRALPIAIAVGLVAIALFLRGRGRLPETPDDTVAAFFDLAGKGDDVGYLRLVTGTLRSTLESTRSQLGVAQFRDNLRQSTSGMRGFAVQRGNDAPPGGVALEVELVFNDRNEKQRFVLIDEGNGWAISDIQKASMVKPPVAYGTPVFEDATGKDPIKGPNVETSPRNK